MLLSRLNRIVLLVFLSKMQKKEGIIQRNYFKIHCQRVHKMFINTCAKQQDVKVRVWKTEQNGSQLMI